MTKPILEGADRLPEAQVRYEQTHVPRSTLCTTTLSGGDVWQGEVTRGFYEDARFYDTPFFSLEWCGMSPYILYLRFGVALEPFRNLMASQREVLCRQLTGLNPHYHRDDYVDWPRATGV